MIANSEEQLHTPYVVKNNSIMGYLKKSIKIFFGCVFVSLLSILIFVLISVVAVLVWGFVTLGISAIALYVFIVLMIGMASNILEAASKNCQK